MQTSQNKTPSKSELLDRVQSMEKALQHVLNIGLDREAYKLIQVAMSKASH